jgi:hypothetical protein
MAAEACRVALALADSEVERRFLEAAYAPSRDGQAHARGGIRRLMAVLRMSALLVVALAAGTVIASHDGSPPFVLGVAATVVAWLAALLIAGVLIGLAGVVTWDRSSPVVVVVAFVVAGAVAFPMRAEYLGQSNGEEADCTGYVPLARAATLDADEHTWIAVDWRCTNGSLAHNPHIPRTP